MAETIYVVIRSTGEWSERHEEVVGYFTEESEAQEFCLAAEREWKEAAVLFPMPPYLSIGFHEDEFETVYPDKPLSTHESEFGTITFCTPDYSKGQKVPRQPSEVEARKSARKQYYEQVAAAEKGRRSHVTSDPEGSEGADWYYEKAGPLRAGQKSA